MVLKMTIKEYVIAKNITLTSIADLIPCTPQYISMISAGKSNPSYKMAKRIEEVTNGEVEKENWYPKDE
jgi:transcriptional regulator with XRE-family HTH domain